MNGLEAMGPRERFHTVANAEYKDLLNDADYVREYLRKVSQASWDLDMALKRLREVENDLGAIGDAYREVVRKLAHARGICNGGL